MEADFVYIFIGKLVESKRRENSNVVSTKRFFQKCERADFKHFCERFSAHSSVFISERNSLIVTE